MKKSIYLLIVFILGVIIVQAKPVTHNAAKNLAINFYKQHSIKVPQTLTLAYTETSPTGEALYYVFNVNTNDGFVIVTADDAAHPIIGYSTEKQFKIPAQYTPINYWMKTKKKEIITIKAANLEATEDIAREWTGDFSATSNLNKAVQRNNGVNSVATGSVAPLVQSDWNQSPYYNAYCPGSTGDGSNSAASVTGCVATTMSQIMRYWSYPAHGTGSSSYSAGSYGTLSANYGTTTYNWAGMPLNDANITSTASTYSAVTTIMSQAGISVEMNYAPSGSGAYVLQVDNPGGACAQQSYTLYFGYDPTTIKGYQRTQGGYSDAAWLNLIETDLNAGRPVQYAGQDPSDGGHTWVCDGYDVNNNVHMNWGWAGYDDGYFSINNLQTTNGTFNPSTDHEILVGIQPPASVDAGILAVVSPLGTSCASTFSPIVTLKDYGTNTLTSCTINYQIDGGTVLTYSWTGSLATGQTTNVNLPTVTVTAGSHTLTSATNNPNHTADANTSNNQNISAFVANGVPTITHNTVNCGPQVYTLTATGVGNITWEDAAGNTVGTGSVYTTPLLSATTTYSATSSVLVPGTATLAAGPALNTTLGAGGYLNASHSLIFNVTTAFTLKSVDLYAQTSSSSQPTITLLDNTGVTIYSTSPTLSLAGQNSVSLNWHIPVGTSYSLSISGTNINLYRNNAGASYPISVGTVASITGNDIMSTAPTYYYWFYNWNYAPDIACPSAAATVTTTITNCTTGMISSNSNNSIAVYPNPAHDNIFINATENTSSISVTDIIGQIVVAEQKVTSQQINSIDISNLANGVYLVKVSSKDNQPKIIRFIKN